jgi:hypothetical protein
MLCEISYYFITKRHFVFLRLYYQETLRLSSSLLPVSVLFFVLCTLCWRFLCSFLRLVYPLLTVSLFFSSSCVPYVDSFSVLFFVLCTLCWQFLCSFLRLVYPMLTVSLFFSSSCVPYVDSFSVLFFVLCTLCWQFLCSFLRLVYPMLPVSLDCPSLIAPSAFSNVYVRQIITFVLQLDLISRFKLHYTKCNTIMSNNI